MVAAGCAVGLGNVWRFPYIVGQNGGAAFVLVYLAFLSVLGFPLLVAELSIGRASKRGIARAFAKLARGRHTRLWRIAGLSVFAGSFVLMLYYTDVAGWLAKYAGDYMLGGPAAQAGRPGAPSCAEMFQSLRADWAVCAAYMLGTVAVASAVCFAGVVKGVERVTKFLMVSLFAILAVLASKALTLPAAAEGLRFYLHPDWAKFMEHPWKSAMEAMGQAFFTLSLGIGCMSIFGSYIGKRHSLMKEAAWIIVLDTLVAFLSGLVIFPACLSYGVEPASGPGLIFIALPEAFARMPGGRFWGFSFFLFLAFAALTTIIAVFECIIGGILDEARWTMRSHLHGGAGADRGQADLRRRVAMAVGLAVAVLAMPCIIWDKVMDWEDFAISQLWLPLGAIMQSLFVSLPVGWGWNRFREEAGMGSGAKMPDWMCWPMRVAIPILILAVIVAGIFAK